MNEFKSRREMHEYATSLKDVPCMDCVSAGRDGIWPIVCMQFDHVPNRGPKVGSPTAWAGTFDELLLEIEKCDVICSNCHFIRTHSRPLPDDVREKMSKSQLGRKHTPEALQRIGEAASNYHKRRRNSGKPAPKHSDETKEKLREMALAREDRKRSSRMTP